MKMERRKVCPFLLLALALCLLCLLYGVLKEEAAAFTDVAVYRGTPPFLLILLFTLLPLVGFPINVFLLLLGVKFGAWQGVLIMAVGMPVHLLTAYFIVHSFLRSRVLRLLDAMGYGLPQVPENRTVLFSFLFMAIPGLSYTLKNYILPLSGVPFRCFFLSGFLVQGAMGVPFVIAGEAAGGEDMMLLGGVFAVLACLYALLYGIRKWYGISGNSG